MQTVTIVGNLLAEPELRFSNDKPRATFRVAVNEKRGDEEIMHPIDCTAFGTLAENVVESTSRGMRVIVQGRMNTYKSDVQINGEDKSITRLSVTASAVGPDLLWATAKVSKVAKKDGGQGNGGGGDFDDDAGSHGSGAGKPSTSSKSSGNNRNDDDF